MTIPCVGYAARLDEVAPLCRRAPSSSRSATTIWRGEMRAAIDALARAPEPVR